LGLIFLASSYSNFKVDYVLLFPEWLNFSIYPVMDTNNLMIKEGEAQ